MSSFFPNSFTKYPLIRRSLPLRTLLESILDYGYSASGKAGGFMARDWHRGPNLSLAALSFDLHQKLAEEYGGEEKWGYRRLTTVQVELKAEERFEDVPDINWIDKATSSSVIGDSSSTAQVTPGLFTEAMVSLAQEKGVKVTIATVTGIEMDGSGLPTAVIATNDQGERIRVEATDVLFATGPWTASLAKKVLGKRAGSALDIEPSRCSTSVVFRPSIPVSAHALFTEMHTPDGKSTSPEIYPRGDGTVYMCGDHTDPLRQRPFPERADAIAPSEIAIKNLTQRLAFVSEKFKDAEIVVTQACFRPESKRNRPLIGKLGEGLWIASGHSVWGICNAPGTGKVMSELLLDGEATSADIRGLRP
ncbi:hypothetical protein PIIN_00619 [Serendipita indica DSM 11827]|uniref:FAD dependent oxidoreductase domain-containing protein n=1 Tax=Serendipita indica (strain DSM 11827) TaxID=1109443 RepID=G4T6C7_SERID|nr:hypothetical protein PIIN_00619 [Serendipita indica DSM 11827]